MKYRIYKSDVWWLSAAPNGYTFGWDRDWEGALLSVAQHIQLCRLEEMYREAV